MKGGLDAGQRGSGPSDTRRLPDPGSGPHTPLPLRYSPPLSVKLPMLAGNGPDSSFRKRSLCKKASESATELHVNHRTYSSRSATSSPNDGGTVPVNWLSLRSRTLSFVRLPMKEGMLPDNRLPVRCKN